MRKKILFLILAVFVSITIFFFYIFVKRICLPYNREGNYFDEESLINYKAQAADVYGIIAFASLLFTGILFYKMSLLRK